MLSYSEIARISRSFSVLLHAGIALSEGAYLLSAEEAPPLKTLLTGLGQRLEEGLPLSDALAETGAFPAQVTAMIRIGEETGRMEQTLSSLADFYEERSRTFRQIKNALTYPAMILMLLLLVLGVLLIKVLPVFERVYASLGSGMSGVSAGLLHLGQGLERCLPALLAVLILTAAAVAVCIRVQPIRGKLSSWLLRRFGDRGVSCRFNNARFARGLAMGLGSGLPLEDALNLARQLLSDVPAAAARCSRCMEALEEGKELSEAMQAAALLSPAQSRMLAIGLRGGNADQVMENLAEKLMEEAEDALEAAVSKVEPTMVLVSSLLVGLVLLAVMLPLVNIMSTIG